jgi:predicted Fe-S protein YdhL (DUF1289 family)
MGAQIFFIVYCCGCGRIRKHGEWVRIDADVRSALIARNGEWDTIEQTCHHCELNECLLEH